MAGQIQRLFREEIQRIRNIEGGLIQNLMRGKLVFRPPFIYSPAEPIQALRPEGSSGSICPATLFKFSLTTYPSIHTLVDIALAYRTPDSSVPKGRGLLLTQDATDKGSDMSENIPRARHEAACHSGRRGSELGKIAGIWGSGGARLDRTCGD